MNISVIIIARNEGNWPAKTANDFKNNMPDAEIIGVDDGGTNSWPKFVRVVKTQGGYGVGRCRLLGAQKATKDLIVVTDGHVLYDSGSIQEALELAEKGYIVNPSTVSYTTGINHGSGRTHSLPGHKCKTVFAPKGYEVGMIGSVYFMKRSIALDVFAPTPCHGYNEQIMTCAALSLGYPIYSLPELGYKHLYKKGFNYAITHTNQSRNRELLNWWFFGKKPPVHVRKEEQAYHDFIQANRILKVAQLQQRIVKMNAKLEKDHVS